MLRWLLQPLAHDHLRLHEKERSGHVSKRQIEHRIHCRETSRTCSDGSMDGLRKHNMVFTTSLFLTGSMSQIPFRRFANSDTSSGLEGHSIAVNLQKPTVMYWTPKRQS
jgi:hypothetical protein